MATYTIDATSYRSPNKSTRYDDIWALIIHSCEGTPYGPTPADCNEQNSSLPYLCNPSPANNNPVSSCYYVTREAKIYRLVDEQFYSWHSGDSMLSGVRYCNTYSIGIELEHHKGAAPYPQAQKDALTWLAKYCIDRYKISKENIATHRKVASAVGRIDKTDPTDWTDELFYQWVNSLYGDPLRARTIAGAPNTPAKYTTVELYNFYNERGGLRYNGYPLYDAKRVTYGPLNEEAIVQGFERTVYKQSEKYGIEEALRTEAAANGW